jgi:hypothetical protein
VIDPWVHQQTAGVGFEPTRRLAASSGFQDRPFQPLGHPAEAGASVARRRWGSPLRGDQGNNPDKQKPDKQKPDKQQAVKSKDKDKDLAPTSEPAGGQSQGNPGSDNGAGKGKGAEKGGKGAGGATSGKKK